MGRKRRRLLKWGSLILVLLLLIHAGRFLFFKNTDHNQLRIEGFYLEPADTMDVVFLGSSEVFADFSSPQAYKEYGFTSYPYVVNANPVTLWKDELKEVMDRQHPQLIVVEMNGALYNKKRLYRETSVRRLVDNMPESENRRAIIRDFGKDPLLSYYLPIMKYHSNWENPKSMMRGALDTVSMHLRGRAYLKGISTNTGRLKADTFRDIAGDTTEEPLDADAEAALRAFLDYCKAEAPENVIFVRFPHCITDDEQDYFRFMRTNAAGAIIESYGFDFINLDQSADEIGIDPETDFYNPEHMNVYGMKKLTTWFGKYLVDHYDIKAKAQTEKNRQQWEKSAAFTEAFYAYFEEAMQKKAGKGMEIYESAKVMRVLKARMKR